VLKTGPARSKDGRLRHCKKAVQQNEQENNQYLKADIHKTDRLKIRSLPFYFTKSTRILRV
jgi:hypothetical protein